MKTILLSAFDAIMHPLRIAKAVDRKLHRANKLRMVWLNRKLPVNTKQEYVNNPRHWDVEWFNNYE
jgi:hypothetical protein